MKQILANVRWILLALAAGAALGLAFPQAALTLTPITKLLLQLIKAAATPLVLFAVLEAILRHRVAGGDFFRLLGITLINATVAIAIGLLIANLFVPGQYLTFLAADVGAAATQTDFLDMLAKQLPVSVVQPLADNSIRSVIIMALTFGFG